MKNPSYRQYCLRAYLYGVFSMVFSFQMLIVSWVVFQSWWGLLFAFVSVIIIMEKSYYNDHSYGEDYMFYGQFTVGSILSALLIWLMWACHKCHGG